MAPSDVNCGGYYQGKLASYSCGSLRYFLCFDGESHTCTKALISLIGADQYIVISQSMGWTTARDYCRTYYTDLASLRNNAENQMIQNVSGQMTVWLGLFRDIWEWSDQTYSSMRYWKSDISVFSTTVGICSALVKSASGKWGEVPCGEPHPFICDCSKKDLFNFLSNK
uniref:C-type lectin domain-containing protein n=1 Tax=Mastacembelus armatus TaxID=205130 RepID=A0A3Q3M4N3_9TELE